MRRHSSAAYLRATSRCSSCTRPGWKLPTTSPLYPLNEPDDLGVAPCMRTSHTTSGEKRASSPSPSRAPRRRELSPIRGRHNSPNLL